jgi:hypothetical protein
MQKNSLAFIADVIYRLKREYGGLVNIQRRTLNTVDLCTGQKTQEKDAIQVLRAIILPTRLQRKFDYDLTYIAAAKNFTYGGFYDTDTRSFIFDTADLPKGFTFNIDDALIFKHLRYELKEISQFEFFEAFLIIAKRVKDAPAEAVEEKIMFQEVFLTQTVVATL